MNKIYTKKMLSNSKKILISNINCIGVVLDRNISLVSAIYNCFVKHIPYVPIDPSLPNGRVEQVIKEAKADMVITHEKYLHMIHADSVICVGENEIVDFDVTILERDIAYILFTSGSTGIPKGVAVSRESINNFIAGVSEVIDFSPQKRMACFTTVSFDIFFLESVMALHKGLEVVLASESEQRNPRLMAKLIRDNEVDMIQMTPSRMQMLINYDNELLCLKQVKDIILGGEVLPLNLLRVVQTKTSANIYNMYGPTEATIWSTISNLTNKSQVDIGFPIKNTNIYIVDENICELPNGEIGEICISGKGLANGYINNDKLTREKFVHLPYRANERVYRTGDIGRVLPNGELDYLGRLDNQIKLRGHRIELDEIEFFINQVEGVIQSAVVATESDGQGSIIEAYYICEKEVGENEITEYLSKKLPPYMMPVKYFQVESFEQTINGKIDRKKLRGQIKNNISFYEPSCNEKESSTACRIFDRIVDVLRDISGSAIENISLNSSLRELKIDSINFIMMVISLETEFRFEFDNDKLVISEFVTLGDIVKYVEAKQAI